MRLPSERASETIAAAAEAGVTVFDTARAYDDNEQLVAGALRGCGAAETARIVTKGGMTRPGGAWVPDGRAKAILRRLRSEPHRPGRPADRPLPPSCSGSADAVEDVGAGAGAPGRPRPGPASRARERQSAPARRGAGARPRRSDPGGTQPLRRPRAPRRDGRALRRARDHAVGAFAAWRAEAGRTCRRAGDARVAPGTLACRRSDPRGATSRDCAVGRGGRRNDSGSCSAAPAPLAHAHAGGCGGRPRDGHSGSGEEPYCCRLHDARLRSAQPRRAGRIAARARRGCSTSTWPRAPGGWCSTTRTSPARRGTT